VSAIQVEVLELKKENKALKETVTLLLKEIDRIREVDRSSVINLRLSPEQRILDMQIRYLEAISMDRALTLEETRALDLHIKNKRLLEDKSTINADYTKVPEGLTESDLMRIAGNVEEEEPINGRPVKGSKKKSSSKNTVESRKSKV